MSTPSAHLPEPFMTAGTSSFAEFSPTLTPRCYQEALGAQTSNGFEVVDIPHGTTIVTRDVSGGVVMAGDRRATAGNIIAQRDIEGVCCR